MLDFSRLCPFENSDNIIISKYSEDENGDSGDG